MLKSSQNGAGSARPVADNARRHIRHFDDALSRARVAIRQGKNAAGSAEKLAQLDQLEQYYRGAWKLRCAGWSVNKICAHLRDRSVARWFKGSIPRQLLNLDPKFRQKLERQIRLPAQPSPELAFILGVFCGRSGIGGQYRGFEIHSRDGALVERLAQSFEAAFSLRGASTIEDYGGVRYHYFGIGSNHLARYLVAATSQNTSVPLRELANHQCRRAFLEGFFASCGSAIRPEWRKISVVKSRNSKLLSEVAVILKREGVLALVRGDNRAELLIQDQNDLQRFKELELLLSPSDVKGLEEICASRPQRRMFIIDEYKIAMKVVEENPSLHCGELSALISEQTAGRIVIDQSVLRQWRKGAMPASVKRAQRLAPFELAMRTSPQAIEMQAAYQQQLQHLHDAERILMVLRELAWLKGENECEFPLELPQLDYFRDLHHKLGLPFGDVQQQAWHAASRDALQKRIAELVNPEAVLDALREVGKRADGQPIEVPRSVASLVEYQNLLSQYGVKLSKEQRQEWTSSFASKQELLGKIASARSPSKAMELLDRLGRLNGESPRSLPIALPTMEEYRLMFQSLSVPFGDHHICGWHEAMNASPEVDGFEAIAKGIHNLIRRRWRSAETWVRELPASIGNRASRTIDALIGNKPVLQRDLIELITFLGVEKAAPAMRFLVGLSIASQSQVILHLAETTAGVRDELSKLLQAKQEPKLEADSASAHLYELLPGIDLASVYHIKAEIVRALAEPETSAAPLMITEDKVLDWLEHIPKYRPRLGSLTELAKKAQQAGLGAKWAVSMMKDMRARRSE